MERCSKCNSVLKSDSKFCPGCGAKVTFNEQQMNMEGNGIMRISNLENANRKIIRNRLYSQKRY